MLSSPLKHSCTEVQSLGIPRKSIYRVAQGSTLARRQSGRSEVCECELGERKTAEPQRGKNGFHEKAEKGRRVEKV